MALLLPAIVALILEVHYGWLHIENFKTGIISQILVIVVDVVASAVPAMYFAARSLDIERAAVIEHLQGLIPESIRLEFTEINVTAGQISLSIMFHGGKDPITFRDFHLRSPAHPECDYSVSKIWGPPAHPPVIELTRMVHIDQGRTVPVQLVFQLPHKSVEEIRDLAMQWELRYKYANKEDYLPIPTHLF